MNRPSIKIPLPHEVLVSMVTGGQLPATDELAKLMAGIASMTAEFNKLDSEVRAHDVWIRMKQSKIRIKKEEIDDLRKGISKINAWKPKIGGTCPKWLPLVSLGATAACMIYHYYDPNRAKREVLNAANKDLQEKEGELNALVTEHDTLVNERNALMTRRNGIGARIEDAKKRHRSGAAGAAERDSVIEAAQHLGFAPEELQNLSTQDIQNAIESRVEEDRITRAKTDRESDIKRAREEHKQALEKAKLESISKAEASEKERLINIAKGLGINTIGWEMRSNEEIKLSIEAEQRKEIEPYHPPTPYQPVAAEERAKAAGWTGWKAPVLKGSAEARRKAYSAVGLGLAKQKMGHPMAIGGIDLTGAACMSDPTIHIDPNRAPPGNCYTVHREKKADGTCVEQRIYQPCPGAPAPTFNVFTGGPPRTPPPPITEPPPTPGDAITLPPPPVAAPPAPPGYTTPPSPIVIVSPGDILRKTEPESRRTREEAARKAREWMGPLPDEPLPPPEEPGDLLPPLPPLPPSPLEALRQMTGWKLDLW